MADKLQEEKKQTKRKPLTLKSNVTLSSKESGEFVRQSLSHGRSKSVEVEVKRKRRPKAFGEIENTRTPSTKLTELEQDVRFQALKEFKQIQEDSLKEKQLKEKEAQIKAEEEEKLKRENEKKLSAEHKEQKSSANLPKETGLPDVISAKELEKRKNSIKSKSLKKIREDVETEEEYDESSMLLKKKITKATVEETKEKPKRSFAKRVQDSFRKEKTNQEDEEETKSKGPILGLKKLRKKHSGTRKMKDKVSRKVEISRPLTVQSLAEKLSEKVNIVIKILMKLGTMGTVNQIIDEDTAELVIAELGHVCNRIEVVDLEKEILSKEDDTKDLKKRPPIVTIMGHVDHGKTSLLDALRKTDVAAKEAGGITQHIGAYQIKSASGEKITFIDTPGHEAFTSMRARGANATDIVILVIAADDGIKTQTIEAIRHAQAANVPMIIAINKIDKPEARPDILRQKLLSYEIVLEKLGGEILDVEISALTGKNLDKLEELILLQAELLELKANPNCNAQGVVLETHVKKGYGSVVTLLVQKGTLRKGDIFVVGKTWGRVRTLFDDKGKAVKEATPSFPVEVSGLSELPDSGDSFIVVENETQAHEILEKRKEKLRDQDQDAVTNSKDFFTQLLNAKKVSELPVILKADVQGSLEGIVSEFSKIQHEEVRLKVIYQAVGPITESDVDLAAASGGIVLGFNIKATPKANILSQQEKVPVLYYNVIYNAIDEIKKRLSGLLPQTYEEIFLGRAEVIQIFNLSRGGLIIGSLVKEGVMRRGEKIYISRNGKVIHEDKIKSLKHKKDTIKEAQEGYETGIGLEKGFDDIQLKDVIECFEVKEIQRSIS